MLNSFIFGNLLYFNRTILCILTVRAVQLCKIQRDFLRICTLYVELCRYFCADVARRRGTRFVRSCWKRKKRRGGVPSQRGLRGGWFARDGLSGKRGGRLPSERCSPLHGLRGCAFSTGFYLIIYTYKKHPARQRGAAGGVARVLIYFRSDP